ncbi:unnamed protein product [Gadus morhua 'NCC']
MPCYLHYPEAPCSLRWFFCSLTGVLYGPCPVLRTPEYRTAPGHVLRAPEYHTSPALCCGPQCTVRPLPCDAGPRVLYGPCPVLRAPRLNPVTLPAGSKSRWPPAGGSY